VYVWRKDGRVQHLHSIFRRHFSYLGHVIGRHSRRLVKKLFKPAWRARQDHFAVFWSHVRPDMRNFPRQPYACPGRQTVFVLSRAKYEFSRQNVKPLVFAVVHVQRRPILRSNAKLENTARACAIRAGEQAGGLQGRGSAPIAEAILTGFGQGDLSCSRRSCREQIGDGRDSESREDRATVDG